MADIDEDMTSQETGEQLVGKTTDRKLGSEFYEDISTESASENTESSHSPGVSKTSYSND